MVLDGVGHTIAYIIPGPTWVQRTNFVRMKENVFRRNERTAFLWHRHQDWTVPHVSIVFRGCNYNRVHAQMLQMAYKTRGSLR